MLILRNPLLDSFEAIARLGTAHAAAKELRVTQTAITQRIKALEAGLKLTLFLRSRRGMSLTEEGIAVLQFHKMIRGAEGELWAKVSGDQRQEVSLTVVGPTSAVSTRIAENCISLYEKYPFLRLHLRSDDHGDLVEMVKRGDADFAIVPPALVPNEMQSKRLKADRYLLVASSKWKNRDLKDIIKNEKIIDFYEADRTTIKFLEKFELHHSSKPGRLFVNENEALIKYFARGVGYGTLMEAIARPYLENGSLIRLSRHILEDEMALVWYARTREVGYFDEIIRSIK